MPKRLRPLSGLDAAFLYLEAAGTPMHVGSVMLLRAPKRKSYDFHRALVAHIQQRLPRAAALCRVLREAPFDLGHPMWGETMAVDLDRHIATRRLPAPGSPTQLWRLVADLHADPLPRDRPLWQFVVIDGLASGERVLYTKVHHALLDGQGGVALAEALLDVHPTKPGSSGAPVRAVARSRTPSRSELAEAALRAGAQQIVNLVRALPKTLKVAAAAARDSGNLIGRLRDSVILAPATPFNARIGPQRSYAVASLPLDAVKQVAHHFSASLNDVVLALCAATLRDYLRRRKALPKKPLIAAMPISLRVAGDAAVNNQVSMVQCTLPTDIADPVARLRAISTATGQIKRKVGALRGLIPTDFPGFAAPIWATGLSRLWGSGNIAERLPQLANVVVSNVPGPPIPLYLAGAKVLHSFPVSIVTHGLGLNITANSYAGQLEFGLIAARDIVPKLDALAGGLQQALDALTAQVIDAKVYK
jgi:WS/DGAT/MGAT family acyltransferase